MECHQSLIHADYLNYRFEVAKHHSGTLKWILEHNHYKNWARLTENDNSAFLWISGNPGCGKPVLSRFLMDSLEASLEARQLTRQCVLYFFFDDKYDTQKLATSFLRALLHQIIRFIPGLIRHAIPEYRSQADTMVNSLATLWKIFLAVIEDQTVLDGIYIVVDALDECKDSSRDSLLQYFRDYFAFRRSGHANLATLKFLSLAVLMRRSRESYYPLFAYASKQKMTKETPREIISFIADKMEQLRQTEDYSDSLIQEVRESLTTKADGMFLWASLIIEDLLETPLEGIQSKLRSLPSGLDDLYKRLLDQIGKRQDTAQMAIRILMWVSHAPRPMSVEEIAWAYTMDCKHHKSANSVDSLGIIDSFGQNIRNCGPILKLDKNGTVKLTHQ